MVEVRVQTTDFDPGVELSALRVGKPAVGAIASFIGIVRDVNEVADRQATVGSLTLEHYPGMTEQALEAICAEAGRRWALIDTLVIHRYGKLLPTDQIVFVATSSAHRGDAFDACAFIMDFLKTQAPFWKKEVTPDGDRWVEARGDDQAAVERWQVDREPRR
ncbi:MAG: molybdenum cofactor biosynthesis protein MoaE [Burkholderiaceae bacterium]